MEKENYKKAWGKPWNADRINPLHNATPDQIKATKELEEAKKPYKNNKKDAQDLKQSACVTGYTMTAMAALRAWNLYQATSTMSDSCDAVNQLAADATATGATAPQPDAKFSTTPTPAASASPVIQ